MATFNLLGKKDGFTVAILGATGLVGAHLIQILQDRKFPVGTLIPMASKRTAGSTVSFQGNSNTVVESTPEAFEGVDIVLASAGGAVSETLVPEAVKRGCVVIDNTSFFRLADGVPLVVAGVNDADIANHQGVISNPNCSTAQLMPVFKALDTAFGINRAIVSTYQSVSGAGKDGMDELIQTTRTVMNKMGMALDGKEQAENTVFSRPIAFNLVPQIDRFVDAGLEAGYTKEETKVIHESRKILHRPDLKITVTAVRVPVLIGHSEAVTLDFNQPVSPSAVSEVLKKTSDVVVAETPDAFPTPIEVSGKDPVYVGRIRQDTSNPEFGVNLWVVADNLRIGAALNAVRLAESLVAQWVSAA
ncbi:MAG: aspartate-semialdehyde dehydrogenase [Cyanobacteria bacterium P01_H01_bin.74]